MNKPISDPVGDGKAIVAEITAALNNHARNTESLVREYTDFVCRGCGSTGGFEIRAHSETRGALDGSGYIKYSEWSYDLYVPINWMITCQKCKKGQLVGFQYHFYTSEWGAVREKMLSSVIDKGSMQSGWLGNYSYYEFFDGRLSFEK